jgi:tetratricopeptide (TPR) repeat protein
MREKIFRNLPASISGVLITAALSLLLPSVLMASQPMTKSEAKNLMAQGNKYYEDKQYEKAVDAYQEIISARFEGTSLYYNLGDAYYREGKLGLAILYYEKALRLSPGNGDVIHNLKITNARTIDKIEALPQFFLFEWWESLLAALSVTGWTFTVYLFYIIVLLSIGLYFFAKRGGIQRFAVYSGFVSIVLLIVTSSLLAVKLNRDMNVKSAIVIAPTAVVKLSPDQTSNDAFIIHEGLKVRELNGVGNWIDIRLEDGKEGWIQKNDLATI